MSLREQDGKKILDLEPHKVKLFLKYLTEGCLATDQNGEGSERKYIWDYLQKNYGDKIEYRDFLLAIRRFIIDGKMMNNDGFYQMHPAVIEEVKKKTPTPALKKSGSGDNIILKYLKDKKSQQRQGSKESSRQRDGSFNRDEESKAIKQDGRSGSSFRNTGSKISKSGKKQKVKPHKESTRQSTIYKYYMKKQMQKLSSLDEFDMSKISSNKGLGFATPAPDYEQENEKEEEDEDEEPIVEYRDESDSEDQTQMAKSQSKLGFYTQQTPQKKSGRGRKSKLQQSLSQKVEKKTKAISKSNQKSQTKEKKQVKSKIPKSSQRGKKTKSLSQDLFMQNNEDNTTSETENRHPIHFLTQPVEHDHKQRKNVKSKKYTVIENQLPKQRGRSKKAENLLDQSTIKALKEAVLTKNIRFRKQKHAKTQQRSLSQESSQRSAKKVQKKTKAIQKVKPRRKIAKLSKMRLRGKTLDLTKLGIISKPKVKLETQEQPRRKYKKQQQKPQSRGATPKKIRKSSIDSYDANILSQRSDRKSQHSQERLSQPLVQRQSAKKPKSKSRQSSKARKSRKSSQGNGSKVQISNIIYYDRQAKLDAAKNLKKLYDMHSTRDGLLVDEKLIYL